MTMTSSSNTTASIACTPSRTPAQTAGVRIVARAREAGVVRGSPGGMRERETGEKRNGEAAQPHIGGKGTEAAHVCRQGNAAEVPSDSFGCAARPGRVAGRGQGQPVLFSTTSAKREGG